MTKMGHAPCGGSFSTRVDAELTKASIIDGPLYVQVLERGATTLVLFGEVHSRSRCPQRAAVSVPELVRRTLQCRGRGEPVDLFVEEDLDQAGEHPPSGPQALDMIRSVASAYRRAPHDGVRLHYTDPRSRLCIPSHPHIMETVAPLLRHRHQNGELNQTLMRILDEVVRRPLTTVLSGRHVLFTHHGMRPPDKRTFFRLLGALRSLLRQTDETLLRRPPTQLQNSTITAALEQYSFLSNRLHDLYLLGTLIRPAIQNAVVYLGFNHALFLGRVLRTHMGFRLVREYGHQRTQEADGCLRVAETRKSSAEANTYGPPAGADLAQRRPAATKRTPPAPGAGGRAPPPRRRGGGPRGG
jgi:hypothetical protein